jgi:hypothetical protein
MTSTLSGEDEETTMGSTAEDELDALIGQLGWTAEDALRLGRVLRALIAAGLIDDCHVLVPAELGRGDCR